LFWDREKERGTRAKKSTAVRACYKRVVDVPAKAITEEGTSINEEVLNLKPVE